MIFYFSAEGNSKHVSECIQNPNETLISITDAVRYGAYEYHVDEDRIGIVSPTYDWTLPAIVSEFLNKLTLHFDKKPYLFKDIPLMPASTSRCRTRGPRSLISRIPKKLRKLWGTAKRKSTN